ncbi:MAG: hypothetical protein ACYS21_17425, partial [Planctomycetota bacterium]
AARGPRIGVEREGGAPKRAANDKPQEKTQASRAGENPGPGLNVAWADMWTFGDVKHFAKRRY